jgi:hypothetical protein
VRNARHSLLPVSAVSSASPVQGAPCATAGKTSIARAQIRVRIGVLPLFYATILPCNPAPVCRLAGAGPRFYRPALNSRLRILNI